MIKTTVQNPLSVDSEPISDAEFEARSVAAQKRYAEEMKLSDSAEKAIEVQVNIPSSQVEYCDVHPTEVMLIREVPGADGKVVLIGNHKYCPECVSETSRALEKQEEHDRKKARARATSEMLDKYSGSGVRARFMECTFDGYEIYDDRQNAVVEGVKGFVKNPGFYVALVLAGKPGTGKNYLASAAAMKFIQTGKTVLLCRADEFLGKIKASYRNDGGPDEEKIISDFSKVDILFLDEVSVIRGTENDLLCLTRMLSNRYDALKPTVYMGNMAMDDLRETVGDQIYSRLREGYEVLYFEWESYRERVARQRGTKCR